MNRENIDPQCAEWLPGVQDVIVRMLGGPSRPETVLIGHGHFNTRTLAAFSGNNESDLIRICNNG